MTPSRAYPSKGAAAAKRYRNKNKGQAQISHRRKRYGLTHEQFQMMLIKQENRCAACGVLFSDTPKTRVNVDHSHKTNKIRGLLCTKCNAALGMLDESLDKLHLLKKYVEAYCDSE